MNRPIVGHSLLVAVPLAVAMCAAALWSQTPPPSGNADPVPAAAAGASAPAASSLPAGSPAWGSGYWQPYGSPPGPVYGPNGAPRGMAAWPTPPHGAAPPGEHAGEDDGWASSAASDRSGGWGETAPYGRGSAPGGGSGTPTHGGSAPAPPPTGSRYAEPPPGVSPGVPAAVPPTAPQVPYVSPGTAAAPWPARASDAPGVVPPAGDGAAASRPPPQPTPQWVPGPTPGAAPQPAPGPQTAASPQEPGTTTAVPDPLLQYADYYRQRYGLEVTAGAAASAQRAPSGTQPPADPSVTPGYPATAAADASFSGANAAPGRRDYSTLAADAVVESATPVAELDLQREGDQIVAVIGPEVVLLSEVLPAANRYLEQNADRIPSGYMEEMRRAVVQQLAERLIQTKLILVDFRQTVPEENQKRIRQQFERLFEEEEVPRLMEEHEITSRSQLEQKLRESGVTLDQLRREFVDRTLAQQWVREQVGSNAEITHEEMLAWYVAHLDDYRYPAKVRWQQLTVHARDGRTKAEAYARLAELGNRVLAGEPFEKVAREASEGLTAADGGINDWTSQGSLVCEDLDRALFSLPVGAMSRIIEDGDAFHIVRVLQRQEAGRVPFRDAQVEIKKNLQRERMEKRYNDYLGRLRARTRVWTAFGRPATGVADNAATSQR